MKRWLWVGCVLIVVGVGGAGTTIAVMRWRGNRAVEEQHPGGKPIAIWVELLGDSDPKVADPAMKQLEELGEKALPVLLEGRKSSDMRTHRRAVLLLVRLGKPAVGPLIEVLPHGGTRVETALVRIGPDAIPGLEKALRGSDPLAVSAAARVLGMMGERARAAVPVLAGVAQDGAVPEKSRGAVITALGRIGAELGPEILSGEDDPIVPTLTALLATDGLRLQAARALAGFGRAGRQAVADLARLLRLTRDDETMVVIAACLALGATGSPQAAIPLARQLGRTDSIATTAAVALARLGPSARAGVPLLIAAMKSDKAEGRLAQAVLERLGEFVVADLQAALANSDARIRRGAADVLGVLGPRASSAAKALAARFDDPQPHVALSAARAYARVDPENAGTTVTSLEKLLDSKYDDIADGAAVALIEIGSSASGLMASLQIDGENPKRAIRAAMILGGIRPAPKSAVDQLIKGLAGPLMIRPACIEALGKLGEASRPALPTLRKLLTNRVTRPAAALALMRISLDEAPLVAEKLGDDLAAKDEPVRAAALLALAAMDIPPAEVVPALRPLLGDPRLGWFAVRDIVPRLERSARVRLIPDLVGLLGSSDRNLRLGASQALRALGVIAGPSLSQALSSKSPWTRGGALFALRNMAFRASIKDRMPLLDMLDEGVLQKDAAETLGYLGLGEMAEAERAVEFLSRPEADVRWGAVRALGQASGEKFPATFAPLAECLVDPDEYVREEAVRGFEGRECPQDWLLTSAQDGSLRVRLAIAETLAKQKQPKKDDLLPKLLTLARVVEVEDLFHIVEIIFKLEPGQARVLERQLESIMWSDVLLSNRIRASVWLSRLDPAAKPRTLRFLKSIVAGWNESARLEAVSALGQMGRKAAPAIPTLVRRREVESDRDVRVAIDKALEKIRPGS